MLIWVLNIAIGVIGVAVLVGWIRHQRRANYRDIERAEISDDLAAADELVEDVINEQERSQESSGRR